MLHVQIQSLKFKRQTKSEYNQSVFRLQQSPKKETTVVTTVAANLTQLH